MWVEEPARNVMQMLGWRRKRAPWRMPWRHPHSRLCFRVIRGSPSPRARTVTPLCEVATASRTKSRTAETLFPCLSPGLSDKALVKSARLTCFPTMDRITKAGLPSTTVFRVWISRSAIRPLHQCRSRARSDGSYSLRNFGRASDATPPEQCVKDVCNLTRRSRESPAKAATVREPSTWPR